MREGKVGGSQAYSHVFAHEIEAVAIDGEGGANSHWVHVFPAALLDNIVPGEGGGGGKIGNLIKRPKIN